MSNKKYRIEQDEVWALTLWRPWPHAIFYGGKRVENRSWRPRKSIAGRIMALHAGLRYDKKGAEWMRHNGLHDPPEDEWCPKGCIVGTARVTGYCRLPLKSDPWFFGPFGWILEEVLVFDDPIPCKGRQGLWKVPGGISGGVLGKVNEAYAKAYEKEL